MSVVKSMPVDEFRKRSAAAAVANRISAAELLAIAVLLGGFAGVVLWFDAVDFYHRHYFDTGPIVAANNAVRIVFAGIFAWLIYAPGAGTAALLMTPSQRAALSPAERAVLGFGIGVGIWHVAMLILGILGLYYRAVMVGLCLVVLVASARHFARCAVIGCRALAARIKELRQGNASPQTIGATLVVVVAAWLLLRRGLFPGGSGDYYTHYFYYYLAVLKNHGLAPNDVWYHYYYDKGNGLAFLGMLLTDPEAPALATFCYVMCAAIAMMTLAERMAPQSLWPAAGTLVYLLFYLLSNTGLGEGEFQKDHEETTALIVLAVWALCMERCGPPRPFRVMAAASAIAAAILTQVVGIMLGLFVGLLWVWAVVRRRWRDVFAYGAIGATIAGTVLAVYVLNYLQTGLPGDQPIDAMLHFTDFSRLDRWGVIPMVIFIAWQRDNYQALMPGFGWGVVKELKQFIRFEAMWPFLFGPAIAALLLRASNRLGGGRLTLAPDAEAASFAAATAARLAALLSLLVVIAITAGRAQNISFFRFSTFFVPVAAMFGVAGSVWALTRQNGRHRDWWAWNALPILLLLVVVAEWQGSQHWSRRVPAETANALRFLSGWWSSGEAYGHAESGYPFGAINPEVLAAARQLPPGTPIWSINVDPYCMVPGCLIESAVSFKMSGRLDDILGGSPELAKQRLQEAGLNYFLFMKDYRIIDLLPFSKLFAPETIGRYLGVKWTDGSTFLLTWIGPDTRPIGSDFLEAYARRRAEPDALRWFRFDELAPLIVKITPRMRAATQWGAADKLLTWRQVQTGRPAQP
jgi:uncharacterized membrane protein